MNTMKPEDALAAILGQCPDPAALLRSAVQSAASGQAGNATAQQQLELLMASDPNLKNHIRSGIPASVQDHHRKLPTMQVVFRRGPMADGSVFTINKSDYDVAQHMSPEQYQATIGLNAQSDANDSQILDNGPDADSTGIADTTGTGATEHGENDAEGKQTRARSRNRS